MTAEVVQSIAKSGLRVFNREDLTRITEPMGLSKTYMLRMLSLMTQNGSFISYGKGLYSLPTELLSGGPIHTFEIALKLAKKGSISHRSAFSYHELSDQIFSTVYITVPKEAGANLSGVKEYVLRGDKYNLIRVSPQNYWGNKQAFLGEAKISVTDLEKTLIDGLANPAYCGGFREVLFAFEKGLEKASPQLLLEYAQKTSLVTCKRLGFVLDKMRKHLDVQKKIEELSMPYYQKLDQTGLRKGKINKRWHLIENI
ncbi:type IV toxin-antitoxin system AbiEi family antitoxin domain-containing protein [Candidatus Nucleicultrix amoebiphila]|uniref:AbiEi antitoxin C-terminal domain-containing protein n=1 Tax=Candidatus Nucleicultrix amoebiphila FS5 TaxID=1414854 RepID=A0A1W6N4Z3_9PROT|nr:hypothetical protein [Candidatus Nucleicultrix amoebiphila]ARN84861.1 hypothetical protein GQ61_05680 [Candidatus Nucleicultrix amoebiphila FS5]